MKNETLRSIPKHYSDVIREELSRRNLKNENYSLRAFARDLNLAPAHLSDVLAKKSILSLKKAQKASVGLGLSSEDQKFFLKLVEVANASEKDKKDLEKQLYNYDSSYMVISNDLYASISQWHSLALLELISLKDFEFNQTWISERLGVSLHDASLAMEILFESKLIAIENGKIEKRFDYFALPNGNNSYSAMRFHKDVLLRAAIALDKQKREERNFTAGFIHVKKEDIAIISERIKIFRRELAKEFESNGDADSVYMFAAQLFRVDQEPKV